jgi:S-adenosylmethionine hydroxide adenosyltransferase-like protein
MLVHVIADYGPGDLAFAEVAQRLKLLLPDAEPLYTPVPAFATLAAGFCVAQLGLNPAPAGTLVYHNVAPRTDDEEARPGNEGERLAFARLPNGVRVIGVNAGYAFSFVRDAAEELRWVSVPAEGSQFRSRDLFPEALGDVVAGHPEALAGEIPPSSIPGVPKARVAYTDGYGNLKTTVEHRALGVPSGTRVRVRIGTGELAAVVSDGSFEVEEGELALAPGSSGWAEGDGQEARWMELFLRGDSAWESFGRPDVGARVEIDPGS